MILMNYDDNQNVHFKNKVITIYSICYDGNPDQIYTFINFDKAVASIEGSVRDYYGNDSSKFDSFCDEIKDKIYQLKRSPCIPLKFDKLQVILYSWELDHTNSIHNILSRCYDQAITIGDETLANDINKLFADSVRN